VRLTAGHLRMGMDVNRDQTVEFHGGLRASA